MFRSLWPNISNKVIAKISLNLIDGVIYFITRWSRKFPYDIIFLLWNESYFFCSCIEIQKITVKFAITALWFIKAFNRVLNFYLISVNFQVGHLFVERPKEWYILLLKVKGMYLLFGQLNDILYLHGSTMALIIIL